MFYVWYGGHISNRHCNKVITIVTFEVPICIASYSHLALPLLTTYTSILHPTEPVDIHAITLFLLLNQKINSVMKVYVTNGTLIKTSSSADGFIVNQIGSQHHATTITNSTFQNVIAVGTIH